MTAYDSQSSVGGTTGRQDGAGAVDAVPVPGGDETAAGFGVLPRSLSPAALPARVTYGCGCEQSPFGPIGEYVSRCDDHRMVSELDGDALAEVRRLRAALSAVADDLDTPDLIFGSRAAQRIRQALTEE